MSQQIPILSRVTFANGYLNVLRSEFKNGLSDTIGVIDNCSGTGIVYFERDTNKTHGDEVHSWVYKNASGDELIVMYD